MTRILLVAALLLLPLLTACKTTPTSPPFTRDSLSAGSALYYTAPDSTGAPAVMLLNYNARKSRVVASNAVLLCRPAEGRIIYANQLPSWPIALRDMADTAPRTILNGLLKARLSHYNGEIALYDRTSIRLASERGDLTGGYIRMQGINDIDFIPGGSDLLVAADAGLYRVDALTGRAMPYELPAHRTFEGCRYPPSGKLLYFIAHAADTTAMRGLSILDVETGRTRLVAAGATSFELSNDGRFAVFVKEHELWLVNTSTFYVGKLGATGVVDSSALSWSHTSNWISFTKEENGRRYLEIINTVDPTIVVRIAETENEGFWEF